MRAESLKKREASAYGINWLTTSVMILFHVGAIAALFFFTWKAFFRFAGAVVDFRRAGYRDGLSPAADASRLQDFEVGGIFSDDLARA